MAVRYLPEQGGQGFVDVIMTATGERIALPGYLKINYLRTRNNRDYFIPYEGKWKNRELSITRKPDGGSYLVYGYIRSAAQVILNPAKANIWYGTGRNRVGPIFAQIDSSNQIPDGTYDLSVPDEAHRDYGEQYLSQSSYSMVWFPIPLDKDRDGRDDERFLHCGRVSEGCATVRDLNYWTRIYKYLYNRRLRQGVVGTITIDSRFAG